MVHILPLLVLTADQAWFQTVVEALTGVAEVEQVTVPEVVEIRLARAGWRGGPVLIDVATIPDIESLKERVRAWKGAALVAIASTIPSWRDVTELLSAGAVDYLRKSDSAAEIFPRLKRLVDAAKSRGGSRKVEERPKRILFVDNEPLKIGALVRAVAELGYHVQVIDKLEDAREALATRWWHLAVVDIRLVDDNNPHDHSGLDLVTRETDRAVPKLILTAYPTAQVAVEALRAYPGELPPAVDFLSKAEEVEKQTERIENAIKVGAGINWELETTFDGAFTFLCMADWLHRNLPQGVTMIQSIFDSAEELADLWARLFSTQRQVVVYPSPQGRSDALLSRVKPYGLGAQRMVVVKCGWREEMDAENQNYQTYVSPYTGPSSTQKLAVARTLHFGAIAYSLVEGAYLEETERFVDYYRAETAEHIEEALKHLFGRVCAPWYALEMRDAFVGIDEAYRRSMNLLRKSERLEQRVRELVDSASSMGFSGTTKGSSVQFHWDGDIDLDLKTLLSWVYETDGVLLDKHILAPFKESPTHGDLSGNNILVDPQGHTWLIDFAQTGYGYRLRDFAELESVIGLDLRRPAALNDLLLFEKLLFSQRRWELGLELPVDLETRLTDVDLNKSLSVIQALRKAATRWEQDHGDLRRYYLALLFEAVLRLVTDGRDSPVQPSPSWRRAHALLRSAVIIKALSPKKESSRGRRSDQKSGGGNT